MTCSVQAVGRVKAVSQPGSAGVAEEGSIELVQEEVHPPVVELPPPCRPAGGVQPVVQLPVVAQEEDLVLSGTCPGSTR